MLQDIDLDPREVLEQWRLACETASEMDAWTRQWHTDRDPLEVGLLLRLHRANFDLWHLEDEARDPLAPDAVIASVKHSIDHVNQLRNDLAERVDEALLDVLAADLLPRENAPLHSETAGQMFDRLSILSLKLFHTAEEAERVSASEDHRKRNRERLEVLHEQRRDLCECLADLYEQVRRGQRRFKLYRQLKMYNDAALNPVLYRSGTRPGESEEGGARADAT